MLTLFYDLQFCKFKNLQFPQTRYVTTLTSENMLIKIKESSFIYKDLKLSKHILNCSHRF